MPPRRAFRAAPLSEAACSRAAAAATSELAPVSAEPTQPAVPLRPFSEIPGPPVYPIVGSAFAVDAFTNPAGVLQKMVDMQKEYGPIYKLEVFGKRIVMVSDPVIADDMWRVEGRDPSRAPMEFWSALKQRSDMKLGNGVTQSNGEEWRRLRIPLNKKLLSPPEIATFSDGLAEAARDLVAALDRRRDAEGRVEGLADLLNSMALEGVLYILYGKRIGMVGTEIAKLPPKYRSFVSGVATFFLTLNRLILAPPLWKYVPTADYRAFDRVMREFLYLTRAEIIEYERAGRVPQDTRVEPLMGYLMAKESLSSDDVAAVGADLIGGGIDTTTNGVQFALYNLATNPEVQERIAAETISVLGGKLPSRETIGKLRSLRMAFYETLRLFPLLPPISRIMQQDIAIGGYQVPAGTLVSDNFHARTRDPNYFPDPERFVPERMDDKVHPNVLLPFGRGPRMCVGMRFAEQEHLVIMATILQKYRVEPARDFEPVRSVIKVAAHPDKPLRLNFVPREGSGVSIDY